MDIRIAEANANNKIVGIEAINTWVDRLYALDKKDRRLVVNRSIASFLNMTPSQKLMFSYYLKAADYSTNGRRLTRPRSSSQNVPLAAVERELTPGVEIRFKVGALGKGMFIGVTPLRVLEARKLERCVCEKGSYYLTHRGDIVPVDHSLQLSRLPFAAGDEVSVRREQNCLIWRRKGAERG